jgi:hypothetical protein
MGGNDFAGVADCGAAMAERTKNPQRWAGVPAAVYDPKGRLTAMDAPVSITRCFIRPSPASAAIV